MQSRGAIALDESRPMWRNLAIFLLPLMLSNVLQSLSQTMSQVFLGRMVGVHALAVVSSIFPLLFLLVSFVIGLGSGSTVLIGQAFGAKDHVRLKAVAGSTVSLAFILGVVVGIFGYFASHAILLAIGTPAEIVPLGVGYAQITFLNLPVLFVYFVYTTFLRGIGDTRTPFGILIVSTILVGLLTPPLVGGWFGLPHLATYGAAIANAISNAVSLVLMLIALSVRKSPLAMDAELVRQLVPKLHIVRNVVRLGVPAAINLIMISLSEIAVISFVNHYGSTATAAYGAVNQIASYVQLPAMSIAIASSVFSAQAIGARRPDRIRLVARSAVTLNYIVEGTLIVLGYLVAPWLIALFTTDVHTQNVARELLGITLWSYAIFGNTRVLSSLMFSSGTVLWPTVIGIFAIWGVEVPAAYLLMQRYGLDGVWYGYPISYAAALAMQFAYYQFVWMRRPKVAIAD